MARLNQAGGQALRNKIETGRLSRWRDETSRGDGSRRTAARIALALVAGLACALYSGSAANAAKIKNPTAVFAGLDKITGRIISFEVAIDETVQFGSLHITPRICFTRPPTEAPQTTSFVEVEEVIAEKKFKKIFAGWMFAASPGLHAVEHPVYDAWLTGCKGGTEVIEVAKPATEDEADSPAKVEPVPKARTRSRRSQSQRSSRRTERRPAPSRQFFPQNPSRRPDINPFGNY